MGNTNETWIMEPQSIYRDTVCQERVPRVSGQEP